MASAETLDYFLSNVLCQDTKKRIETGEELIVYLQNKESSLYCGEMDKLVDGLAGWVNSSSFKVSLLGLEVLSCLIDRMAGHFKPHVTTVLPAVVDRLGDSKDQVRQNARELLLKLMVPASSPQYVVDRLNTALTHKLWKVKDETLICLQAALNDFGARNLSLSKIVPLIVKLLEDQSIPIREQAMTTLVEIYRHVGERLRVDLAKKDINAAKLNALFAKMDEVRSCGQLLVNDGEVVDDDVDSACAPTRLAKRSSSSSRTPAVSAVKSTKPASATGAVDEEMFVRSFEEVTKVYILSAKDVADRMTKIRETLSDINIDWEKRVEALKDLRGVLLAGASEYTDYQQLLRSLEPCLKLSVQDLRSQVVREACITVSFLSQQLGKEFDHVAEAVLPSLFLLIPNTVKIMATSGTTAIRFIVQFTPAVRLIPLITCNIASKSAIIRRQCCEFIDLLVHTWPTSALERQVGALQEAIKKGLGDADPDARINSRRAFWGFESHFKEQASSLFNSLDASQQKQLQSAQPASSSSSSTSSLNARHSQPTAAAAAAASKLKSRSRSISNDRSATTVHSRMQLTQPSRVAAAAATKASRVPRDMADGASIADDGMLRSNSAVNLVAPPGGSARTKSATDSNYCTLPRQKKPSVGEVESQLLATPDRRQRTKNGTSQSQPGSRSNSPSSRLAYITHTQPDVVPSVPTVGGAASRVRSRIPHSQGNSRDASPARPYGRDKRSVGGQPAGRVSLASQSTDRQVNTDLDAAVALLRGVGSLRRRADDIDDAASETSSLCSESSFRSYSNAPPTEQDVADIIASLSSGSWSDRRDGLLALQNFLQSNRKLTRSELKRVTEIFTRMFHDPHLKVFSVYMDTLAEFLTYHHSDVNDWLLIALPRLFNRMAIDVVSSVQTKMQQTLETICKSFPCDHQFNIVSKFIVDQTQALNVKVRVVVLNYIHSLCRQMDPSDLINSSDTRLALTRVIQWTTEPKSVDVRKAAQGVIIALFNLNAAELTAMLRPIPKEFQEGATKILQGHISAGGQYETTEPLSPRNASASASASSLRHRQFIPQSGAERTGSENLNPEDVYDSIRKASADIQSLSRVDSQLSGRPTGLVATGRVPTDRQKIYNPHQYQDSRTNNTQSQLPDAFSHDTDIFNEEFPSDAGVVNGIDDIIAELSNHNTRNVERKQAMLQLIRITRDTQSDIWSEHFKTILLLLLETFADSDDEVRALSLRVLREIVRRQPERFSCYAELTILKLLEAQRDSAKDVNRAAEECAATVACAIPADQCINILNPFVDSAEFPVNLAAIKMQIKVVESAVDKDVIRRILPELVPRLLKGYDNSESSVRKASVFCLVAIYLAVGEELRPFLASLNSSKLKLLNLYIKRALSQKDDSSSETSKTSSPVSVVENLS